MTEVKQMVRTLAPVSNEQTGISSEAEVAYELEQYFNRGFELNHVVGLGDFKIGSELYPRLLYVLVKKDVVEPTVRTRGRPKAEVAA